MAAKQIGITTAGNVQEWIGTTAEIVGVSTTNLGPGSTYWAYDDKAGHVYDGEDWQPLV